MSNSIEACKRAGAKLIFFDNVYMYGKAGGPMTEETPFNPCSKKGEIRAKIASFFDGQFARFGSVRLNGKTFYQSSCGGTSPYDQGWVPIPFAPVALTALKGGAFRGFGTFPGVICPANSSPASTICRPAETSRLL